MVLWLVIVQLTSSIEENDQLIPLMPGHTALVIHPHEESNTNGRSGTNLAERASRQPQDVRQPESQAAG
jgi:hypothetical protein